MLRFSKENLPTSGWHEYFKVATTKAVRVEGEFEVVTREGVLKCPDGYLALDSGGWPYPIAVEEFNRIYQRSEEEV